MFTCAFIFSGIPLRFLIRHVYWQQISSILFYLGKFISNSLSKGKVTGYRILDWWDVLSEHFKYFTPLSFCLDGSCREIECNSYLCSSVGKVFSPSGLFQLFSLSLVFCRLNMLCLDGGVWFGLVWFGLVWFGI